ARLDAEVLLAGILGARREDLYVQFARVLTKEERRLYEDALKRRALKEPVAYILGNREFWSLDFSVAPEVLIPRPETELLVELALSSLDRAPGQMDDADTVGWHLHALDLGTGSGAIAVSLAKERDDLRFWATDLSQPALDTACMNARHHAVEPRIRFAQGDLFEPVADKKDFFDVIVSNPPYIRRSEFPHLPADVREWEPGMALDGGVDGLDFYHRIIAEAPLYLKPEGFLLVEMGPDLEAQVRGLFAASGQYKDCAVHLDYSDRPRVVSARKAPRRG
ncbi:MAG: peptide chain release factor N(5)-glutamine methyltransferase, partial [Candidatus Binatia bacterium]